MTDELKFYTDTTTHPVIAAPAKAGDAGYDLAVSRELTIHGKSFQKVKLDLRLAIPDGYMGMIKDRSGLAARGLHILGGCIDTGYRGEIAVVFANFSDYAHMFTDGDRIAQLLILPVNTPTLVRVASAADLGDTERGGDGFGSTGLKVSA